MGRINDYGDETAITEDMQLLGVGAGGETKNFTTKRLAVFNDSISAKANMYNNVSPCSSRTLAVADTWYKLTSTNLITGVLNRFTFLDGVYTYTGDDTKDFHFSGTANVSSDKACRITFGLAVDNVVIPGGETPSDVHVVAKTANISISTLIPLLEKNKEVSIWAKSDTASTALTVDTIQTVLWS